MKVSSLRQTLLTAMLVLGFSAIGHAQDVVVHAKGGLEAKLEYCKTCHGMSGQGYLGYFPMPRLAGQQPEYIEAQLRAFIERRRTNPIMFNVAHVLSPSMLTALATHFRDLDPKPFGGAPEDRWPRVREFSRRGFRRPMFPLAPRVTAPPARAKMKFRDLRVNFISTPWAS